MLSGSRTGLDHRVGEGLGRPNLLVPADPVLRGQRVLALRAAFAVCLLRAREGVGPFRAEENGGPPRRGYCPHRVDFAEDHGLR